MSKNVGIEPKNKDLKEFKRYYEYTVCMHGQHTNINSESKVKPKENRIAIRILQRFYRI